MPSRTKEKDAAIAEMSAALPQISPELMDQFITGPMMTGEAVGAATMAFEKALIERAMGGAHRVVCSSQATPAAVDKSYWPWNTIIQTAPQKTLTPR